MNENIENEFVLVSLHMVLSNHAISFGFSIINSLEKSIGIAEYIDNDFFSVTENLVLQSAPQHESINFIVIGNFPNEFFGQKLKNILQGMGISNPEILTDSKNY